MAENERWSEADYSCIATYNVLEGDGFLDQFESADLAFAAAGAVQLKSLPYFAHTTSNPQIRRVLALDIARRFVKHLVKNYTVRRQGDHTSADIILMIANMFEEGDATIAGLAAAVNDGVLFPDEA